LSPVKAIQTINKTTDAYNKNITNKAMLRTKVTTGQANKIQKMSTSATKARQTMIRSKRSMGDAKKTDIEMDYGMKVAEFEDYVKTLNSKAGHQTVKENIKSGAFVEILANISKSVRSAFDNSFVGRQGISAFLKGLTGDVKSGKIWGQTLQKSFQVMIGTFKNKPVMKQLRAEIVSDVDYPMMKAAKISLGQMEEEFPIHAGLHKIPILGTIYKATENAYVASATFMRYKTAKMLFNVARNSGVNLDSKIELEGIGSIVNMLTGRISGQKKPGTINAFLWAPNLAKANAHVLTGQVFDKNLKTPFAKKQAALSTLRQVAGAAIIMGTANAINPGSCELDPRSSDFGKIKIGEVRLDFTGGKAAYITLAARIAMAMAHQYAYKSSVTGIKEKLGEGDYKGKTAMDLCYQFLENKTSPTARVAVDFLKQKTFEGKKPTTISTILNLIAPLTPQQVMENREEPTADQLILGIGEAFGFSTSKYSTDIDWKNSSSKELRAFREKVGDEKFTKANDEYNKEVKDWLAEVKDNPRWIELSEEDKMTLYRAKQNGFKKTVYKRFGFKYKPPKSKLLPKL